MTSATRAALHAAIAFALMAATTAPTRTAQTPPPRFPQRLDTYLKSVVKLDPAALNELAGGQPVTKLLDADPGKEVAVFAGIWINAPIRKYIDAVKDIETFETGGGFKVTKKISTPPRIEDFARLQLPPDDVVDLKSCRVGSCDLKLGEEALTRMRSQINWSASDVNAQADRLMRQLALEYVTRYLQGGNASLAVYRDTSRPTFVAQEFQAMVSSMPELTTYIPETRRFLLEFPKFTPPGTTSFLYWQETEFGLKPTLRISHVSIQEAADNAVVTSKMLYASHYFWTGLELRALVPDPSRGAGFWFVTVNRSRSDGLSGFTGTLLRGKVRSEVEEGAKTGARLTKEWLEH